MIKLKYLKDRSIVKIKEGNIIKSQGRIRLSKIKITRNNNELIVEKGVRINESNIKIKGEGSVIGAGSICSKEYIRNFLIVGNPARIIKNNIMWNRDEVFKSY